MVGHTSISRINRSFLKFFYFVFPATKREHFKELRSRLRQMPFIYKSLGGSSFGENLLADYVQVRMRPIDLATLQSEKDDYYVSTAFGDDHLRLDVISAYEMVRSNRTCIIFGHAGVGKTTFASYSVLSVVNRLEVTGFYPFDRTERLLPFLVPLKVLDESEAYPIFSYILRSNRFLAFWGGERRLVRLAKKGRVLIILDGYDEVYSSEDSESHLRAEIDAIFNGAIPVTTPRPPSKSIADFYYYLARAKNRVWLTTRKDFYRQNRLLVESRLPLSDRIERWIETRYLYSGMPEIGYYGIGDPGIASIEILGIWDRSELASKIFDKYRKAKLECDLDEREFLEFVDSYYDDETRKLSLNPLFLTVMSYVYVQHKLGEIHSSGNTLRDLVSECVSLLVQELDAQRVRLPVRHAGKALKDRLAFPIEKIEFLKYFASRTFRERKLSRQMVFTEQDLIDAVVAFTKLANSNTTREIGKKPAAFVKQLIYQGVFVVVDASVNTTFYDFPHRRFREILAVQYWDKEETVAECLSMISERHFAEFVLVFFSTSANFQDRLLTEMLHGIDDSERGKHLADLASTCLENSPDSYSPQSTIAAWIDQMVRKRTFSSLPPGVLNHYTPDQELVTHLTYQLSESMTSDDQDGVRFYATFLALISPQTIQQLFLKLITTGYLNVSRTVCEVVLKHRRELVPPFLNQIDDQRFELLCSVALTMVPAAEKRWWLGVTRVLSEERLSLLCSGAESSAPNVALCIRTLERREKQVNAIVQILTTELRGMQVDRKSDSYDSEEVFSVTNNPHFPVDLIFEQNFLSNTEPSEVANKCRQMDLSNAIMRNPDRSLIVTGTTFRLAKQKRDPRYRQVTGI